MFGGFGQQHAELFPPVSTNRIAPPAGLTQDVRNGLQNCVPGRMPVDVVDSLEEIDIHHHARQGQLDPLGTLPFLDQGLVEGPPRRQPRERVGAGHFAEATFELQHAGARAHLREQLVPVNRLGQEVVGPHVQPGNLLIR